MPKYLKSAGKGLVESLGAGSISRDRMFGNIDAPELCRILENSGMQGP